MFIAFYAVEEMTTPDRDPSDLVHHSYQLWRELWIIDAAVDSMMLCNFKRVNV